MGTNCAGCGAFLPGNEANLRSGLRRFQTTGNMPEDLRVTVDEFRDMVVSDQGGLENLPAVRGGLVRLLREAEIGCRLTMNHVVMRGYDSRPGRAAYADWLATVDRWVRIATVLGIDRKQRAVLSPTEYWAARQAARAAQATGAAPASSIVEIAPPGGAEEEP